MVQGFISLMAAMGYGEMVEFGVLTRFWWREGKAGPFGWSGETPETG
jgi:hypothetical protein